MTDTLPPGGPDRDPFGQPVQPPSAQGYPGYPPQQWYPGYPPHQPYPPGMPPRGGDADSSRTKAVWALVLAILPLCGISWIVALVLAILVLSGPRDGQRRGRGMAWASIVIVVVWGIATVIAMVVAIAYGIDSLTIDRDEDGNVVSGGEAWPEELRAGDCLDEDVSSPRRGDEFETVVPCDEPHSTQVYLEIELDSYDYPSREEIAETGARCATEFEAWVGVPPEASELGVSYLYPSEDNWDYETTLKCVVVAPQDVTESLEGSGR